MDMLWTDQIAVHTKGVCHRSLAFQFLSVQRAVPRSWSGCLIAGFLPSLARKVGKQLHRVASQARHVLRSPELCNEPCGMPGRAASQFFAFQNDDIRNAKLGQMVGNGASDDATAYDDDFGRCGIRARHSELRSKGA